MRVGSRDLRSIVGAFVLAAGCGASSGRAGDESTAGVGGAPEDPVDAESGPSAPTVGTIGGGTDEGAAGGWRHAVEVLPIEGETGTVPTKVSLRLLDLSTTTQSFEAIWVGSRISRAGSNVAGYVSDCVTREVRVRSAGPESADTVVAKSGDIITLPLMHTVALDLGAYVDQILVETRVSDLDAGVQDGGERFFEVIDGGIVPMTQEQYEAAVEASCNVTDCLSPPDPETPVEHAGACAPPSWL